MLEKEKQLLRQQVRSALAALDPSRRAEASAAVRKRLASWQPWLSAHSVAAFWPRADEPDWIGQAELPAEKAWLFPRAESHGRLAWCRVESLSELKPGAFGLREPQGPPESNPSPSLVLVPGLAFDRAGRRLGRGKGFYDRALRLLPGLRVGVAFDVQVVERVPAAEEDAPVDALLTESGLWLCDKANHPGEEDR